MLRARCAAPSALVSTSMYIPAFYGRAYFLAALQASKFRRVQALNACVRRAEGRVEGSRARKGRGSGQR